MIMAAHSFPTALIRGSRLHGLSAVRFRRRRRGLGDCMGNSDFVSAVGGSQSCGPYDTSCIICNTQRANAVSNLMDAGCIAPGTPITFSCDTSQDAVSAFQNNSPLAVNATVGSGSGSFVASGPTVNLQQPGTPAAPSWGGAGATVSGNPRGWGRYHPTGRSPANGVGQQWVWQPTFPPQEPLYSAPPVPSVVNPSPASQSTATGTSALSSNSVTSQANGTVVSTTTTGNWFTDPTQEVISGLPNWGLVAIGGAGLLMVISMARR